MDWKQRASVVTALTDRLNQRVGSCGDAHLQKAVYVLQVVLQVQLEYRFTLDRDGPFSFELSDDLALFRSRNLLRLEPQVAPYGPRYVVSDAGKALGPARDAERKIEFVATKLAGFGSSGLERIAIALFVTQSAGDDTTPETRVRRFMQLKPQVQEKTARVAFDAADEIVREGALL